MQTIQKKLSELTPMEKNVRLHSEKQLKEYERSVRKWGQTKPIVCDENGVIIIGNGLYAALQRAGIETADCYIMTGLSEKDKKKLMLSDNKVYELGITSMDALDDIVKSLEGDFDIPGYDDELLAFLNAPVQDVTKEVMSYGQVEPAAPPQKDAHDVSQYGEVAGTAATSPYSPPPAKVEVPVRPDTPAQAEAPERPFVICPKCGEKIWL